MTLYEATMMAGIPNAPSVYAPTANINLTLSSRQKKVISTMVENEYLTQEQADELIKMQEKKRTFKKYPLYLFVFGGQRWIRTIVTRTRTDFLLL